MFAVAQIRPPFVRFETVAIEDRNASIEAGRIVTKNVDRAFIMQPGSKDETEKDAVEWFSQLRRKSVDGSPDSYPPEWIDQFERKFQLWKQGQEAPLNGTSVRMWPVASPAEIQNLIALHILTVEDVAAMTEEAIGKFGLGGRTLRDKARAWIQSAEDQGKSAQEISALRAELANKDETIKSLERRLSALEEKRGPGRPKKETE